MTKATTYVPRFAMPVVAPPPPGQAPISYYASFGASVTATAATPDGLLIHVSDSAKGQIYAVAGGFIRFVNTGHSIENAPAALALWAAQGVGALFLETWGPDFKELKRKLPAGAKPMSSVLYENVSPNSVRTALQPIVQATQATQPNVLRKMYNKACGHALDHPAPTIQQVLDAIIVDGKMTFFVPAGTLIGESGLTVVGSPAEGSSFHFRHFDSNGAGMSPVVHISGMPTYAGAEWTGHPLIAVVAGIPTSIDFYLKFEVWNQEMKQFDALPSGIDVDLMDHKLFLSDVPLATEQTDNQGQVHFSFASRQDLQALASGKDPDIYFLVHTDGITLIATSTPPLVLTVNWSTKGWLSADGQFRGDYPSFAGTQIGDASDPAVFRVGFDFHAAIRYKPLVGGPPWELAPKGISVSLNTVTLFVPVAKLSLPTDEKGEVHGVLFDVKGGDTLCYVITCEIQDSTIKLPSATAVFFPALNTITWNTFVFGDDRKIYADNDRTSRGTAEAPDEFVCSTGMRNVGLFMLKNLYEVHLFFHRMTGGDWQGVPNLRLIPAYFPVFRSFSWPPGEIFFDADSYWDRATQVHEISHQVMWKQAEVFLLNEFAVVGDYCILHSPYILTTPTEAFVEGWADTWEAVFDGFFGNDNFTHSKYDVPANVLGNSSEGSFANGLWSIFKQYIVTATTIPAGGNPPWVPRSVNGNIEEHAPWINDVEVQNRFKQMLWQPLYEMRNFLLTPINFFGVMSIHPDWHKFLREWQRQNMAMDPPVITSVSPLVVALNTQEQVTIFGRNFASDLKVTFAGMTKVESSDIIVHGSTWMEVKCPKATIAGYVQITVTTDAGSGNNPPGSPFGYF